ncbi:MAG: acetyl-CoA carboxylase biotin carboxyl carrier protein [Candidatus Acidiferrales bacterium]|jgi:acetyl-CoA carboxylase biotin carboxyl carrier protein
MAKKSSSEPSHHTGGVDLPELEKILEFMQKHGLEEFEYERSDLRIRLKKPSSAPPAGYRAFPAPEMVVAMPAAPPPAAPAVAPGPAPVREAAPESARAEDLHIVKSPIVGTFYASASPGAEAFVSIGTKVESGQPLCIIEAMKLMNEIESDVAGEIVRIFVENGQPVEYGESLFGIRTHRKK